MRIVLKTTGQDLVINPAIIVMIAADYSQTGVRLSQLLLRDGSTVLNLIGWPVEVEAEIERLSAEKRAANRAELREMFKEEPDAR